MTNDMPNRQTADTNGEAVGAVDAVDARVPTMVGRESVTAESPVREPVGANPVSLPPGTIGSPGSTVSMGSASSTGTAGVCGPCGFVNEAGSKFCEECGKPLDQSGVVTAERACTACQSTAFDSDGYCQGCGTKAPSPRDHLVVNFGLLATVTDKGISHPINQDAADSALFVGSDVLSLTGDIERLSDPIDLANAPEYDRSSTRAVMVVCDGVSTSSASDVASAAAVSVAKVRLQQCVATEPELAVSALIDAAKLAQTAVSSTPFRKTVGLDAPSCTFVAATVANGRITVGNIGDSRAYVFGDDGQDRHLSADDSWAAEEIRTGRRTPENAESDPRAHMITRWLGSDAPNIVPSIVEHEPASGAIVLLCSDGLWNYASSLGHLRRILDDTIEELLSAATNSDAGLQEVRMLSIAEKLNTFALQRGGHDNITVALFRMGPPITSWTRNSERVPKADAPSELVSSSIVVANDPALATLPAQSLKAPLESPDTPVVRGGPAEVNAGQLGAAGPGVGGPISPSTSAVPRANGESETDDAAPATQHIVINGAVQADTQQGDNP
jgi:serine/threonine protein phosphatase PrpC